MKIALASDHTGFVLKRQLMEWLDGEGVEVIDKGTSSTDSVDYPDFAAGLSNVVLSGEADFGILICNTGIGMSMCANRFKGIRAALCLFPQMAFAARHHNDANVLVLGACNTAFSLAREIVNVFIEESFDGSRHKRRINKMDELN